MPGSHGVQPPPRGRGVAVVHPLQDSSSEQAGLVKFTRSAGSVDAAFIRYFTAYSTHCTTFMYKSGAGSVNLST